MPVRHIEGLGCPVNVSDGTRWFDTERLTWFRFDSGHGWQPIADLNASRVKWAEGELDVLRRIYEAEGVAGIVRKLPGRIPNGIRQRARKLGLQDPSEIRGRFTNLNGADLEEAIRLRDEEGWSFERIGQRFGVAETSASNAYFIAMCPRRGFTPARRDRNGRLLPEEIERLRAMLRKGIKGWDIQLRMGISAACVAEQRRRYQRYLKTNRKVPLPPHGNGERYSGAKIGKERRGEVERLFLTGLGTTKVSVSTGVSKTQCGRIRNRLIKRLARKGECLPGCDRNGKRLLHYGSARLVPDTKVAEVRALLLGGISHLRAALIVGIGDATAYKIRCELRDGFAAKGKPFPPARRVGRGEMASARWLPPGCRWIYFFRQLTALHGEDEARRIICDGLQTLAALPLALACAIDASRTPFERQLARAMAGAAVIARPLMPGRALADVTFGGIASAAL